MNRIPDADAYARVREAFRLLYDTPAPERTPRIDSICGDDAVLRAEVQRLLDAHDAAGSFLAEPAHVGLVEAWAGGEAAATPLPASIGRYAIRSVLGVGGMGVVYLAEQANPQRTVALKVLRPGLATARARSRLAWEAQVLARLQHPGIAQIYEGGEADTGAGPQPFFAMELVTGQPLVAHVQAKGLSMRARVELLAEVCDAVHHAHQRGVIHCDLKPANILVDDMGRPKVLDFGIARAANAEQAATLATVVTAVGVVAGTLPYMSPEQASADPDHIDVRSDVYALGVIAFECCTGRLPHPLVGKNLIEALAIVREADAPRMSSIDASLAGDLETIVTHALEKDRARRYASASELAADLRRYLRDEPIAARSPSGWYHLRKLAARHRGLVFGMAAAVLILVLGLVTTSLLLARATQAERLASRSAEFLQDTVLRLNPIRARGEVRLKDVLQRMSDELESRFADVPLMEADLRQSVGQAFNALSEFQLAEKTLRPAIAIRRRLLGDDDPATLASRSTLMYALLTANRFAEAIPEAQAVLEAAERAHGPEHERTVLARIGLGRALLESGHPEEAERQLEVALQAADAILPAQHRARLGARQSLARVHRTAGDIARAEAEYRRVLDDYRQAFGPDDHDYLVTAANLGSLLADEASRFAEARDVLEPILAAMQRVLGDDNLNTMVAKHGLGLAYSGLGRQAEAEALLAEALAHFRATLGPRHTRTIRGMASLASLHWQRRAHAAAKDLYVEAITNALAATSPTDELVLTHQNNLAILLWDMGEKDASVALLRQVVEKRKQAHGETHRYTCLVETNLAALLVRLGELGEAEQRLVSLESRHVAAKGAAPDDVLGTRGLLADVLERTGRVAEAEGKRRENAEAAFDSSGRARASAADHMSKLAKNLLRQGKLDEAAPWLERAHDLCQRTRQAGDKLRLTVAATFGRTLCQLGRHDEGEAACSELIGAFAEKPMTEVPGWAHDELGRTFMTLGQHAQAEPHLRRAVDACVAAWPASGAALGELGEMHVLCLVHTSGAAAAGERLEALIAAASAAGAPNAEVVRALQAARAHLAAPPGRVRDR